MLEIEDSPRFSSQEQANIHTCKTLLNCYIREFSTKHSNLFFIHPKEKIYSIYFKASDVVLSGKLSYYSAIGEHEYESFDLSKGKPLDYTALVQLIITELKQINPSISEEQSTNFFSKVENSYQKMMLFLEHSHSHQVEDYLSSEQSLLYGHPFHPFPKNTLGFTDQEVKRFCPELRTSFQLCYVAVRQDVFQEEWVAEEKRIEVHEEVQQYVQAVLREKEKGYRLLPLHPWQYEHVQTIQEVREYIEAGKLVPLGQLGPLAYPTSSVRTVYIPEMNCNLKLSLNIQITNMMRNNTREQMRRTLDATRYLIERNCFGEAPFTKVSYEVGIATCSFAHDDLTKLFTIAYRPIEFDVRSTYVLSSLIEVPAKGEAARLFSLMEGNKLEAWFRRYLEISLVPMVRIAEEKGIHFEAHLQNSLVTLKDGMPHRFIIRDLEGVSVDQTKVAEDINTTGPLFYQKEETWARTSYYFIVNHLGSLIHAIARSIHVEEDHFWQIVCEVLAQEYQKKNSEYILHLLTTETFRAKQNMMSCLTGKSEAPSYIPVINVMKKIGSGTYGNNRLLV
ncbi:IucA/IucC family protein [Caldalkalibacillus mannanilyticus]|uniref:IucA/IucC family protein n=1 Tax=Caldalkalibacillus mannanilyticus TaxID=1418 RepID=UPI00046A45CA|nr:IucA/IucC family protein [Caldalkalibacillus mannanilyticus]